MASWEDYVLGYCKNVPLPIANSHAQIGQIIFDLIDKSNSNDEFTSEFNKLCAAGSIYKTHQDNMACIQWYLVKSAYENKLSYGRGAFTLVLDTEEKNLRLYAFATGQLGTATDKETIYSRLSSHLHARCGKVQQGCDKGKIDYPGGNTTSLIALSKEKNIFTGEMRPAVYFKAL